uniref:Uncharacterized protein n=1 Tax=Anguilla anguilla TaxID=7936 RepID=A0A0E9R9K7_ANGAN
MRFPPSDLMSTLFSVDSGISRKFLSHQK